MKLIIGLGNPENQYEGTRHNIGFMCINDYVKKYNVKFKSKFNGLSCEVIINDEKIIFLKPDTYMNNSGEALIKYLQFYKIDLKDVLVIYDDLDLDFGKIRIKQKSSSGGHNGIKSIIRHVKTENFARVKIGINSIYKKDVKNFVLSKFSKEEQKELNNIYDKSNNIIDDFIKDADPLSLMNKYN